jgi:hypothetical protein
MGLYTSIYFHPTSTGFYPTEVQVRNIMAELRVQFVEIASGEPKPPLLEVLRRKYLPRMVETYPIVPNLFWETNVSMERAIQLWREQKPHCAHFMLKHETLVAELTTAIEQGISADLARDFLPWDTGINLGNWEHCDHNTGKITAKGRFAISRSGNGCPRSLKEYHTAFSSIPQVRNFLSSFEAATATPWTTSINLS